MDTTSSQEDSVKLERAASDAGTVSGSGSGSSVSTSTHTSTSSSGSSRSGSSGSAREESTEAPSAVQYVEEVVSVLRRSHPSLLTEVERMLDEFSRRFNPEPEDELLGAVHALIGKCFKHPLSTSDQIPSVILATIDRVCRKFFSADASGNSRNHTAFLAKYKEAFEQVKTTN